MKMFPPRRRLLVGCECSGAVRRAFEKQGWEAWSCDFKPAKDGSPRHLQCDVLEVLEDGWDMGIFHPPCTHLCRSGAWRWKGTPEREAAWEFVRKILASSIPRKVIENPIGYLSTIWRKPDQVIHPWQFGDDASKATCLWYEGDIPWLTGFIAHPPRVVGGKKRWGNQWDSGHDRFGTHRTRAEIRAETYPGVARGMAARWGSLPRQGNPQPRFR